MMDDELLSYEEVAKFMGVSKRTIFAWESSISGFPKKIQINKRTVRFRKSQVSEFVKQMESAH